MFWFDILNSIQYIETSMYFKFNANLNVIFQESRQKFESRAQKRQNNKEIEKLKRELDEVNLELNQQKVHAATHQKEKSEWEIKQFLLC